MALGTSSSLSRIPMLESSFLPYPVDGEWLAQWACLAKPCPLDEIFCLVGFGERCQSMSNGKLVPSADESPNLVIGRWVRMPFGVCYVNPFAPFWRLWVGLWPQGCRLVIVRYLVDPASSHMLVPKIKPCMSKYKSLYGETANGSLYQL